MLAVPALMFLLFVAVVLLAMTPPTEPEWPEWPMICGADGVCLPATVTPYPTWMPATVEAYLTAEAGWRADGLLPSEGQ